MRIVFIGTGEIGVPVLRWLLQTGAHELIGVVTQPDKPVGRDQRLQAPPIKAAMEGVTAVPVLQPERIKREEAIGEIRELNPDVLVVMAYGQILPRSVLEIPRIACLNLHASLLPRHRGAAPIQAALLAGDDETGLTVMYMNEGLDTGDILLEFRLPIAPNETGGLLHDRLGALAPAALEEALQLLAIQKAPRTPQDNSRATYAPKLEREHGCIDWNEPAFAIERKIRAFDPWPGSYTLLRDDAGRTRKLKVFGPTLLDQATGIPGQLLVSNGKEIVVAAHNGALRLHDVQLEGKKRMSAADLLRGHPWIARSTVAS